MVEKNQNQGFRGIFIIITILTLVITSFIVIIASFTVGSDPFEYLRSLVPNDIDSPQIFAVGTLSLPLILIIIYLVKKLSPNVQEKD